MDSNRKEMCWCSVLVSAESEQQDFWKNMERTVTLYDGNDKLDVEELRKHSLEDGSEDGYRAWESFRKKLLDKLDTGDHQSRVCRRIFRS